MKRNKQRILILVIPSILATWLIFHASYDDKYENEIEYYHADESSFMCHCKIEPLKNNGKDAINEIHYNKTTCSRRAYDRGIGQKVIGFSYYGDSRSVHHQEKKYFEGIKNNLELLTKYYSDNWVIRLYYDLTYDDPVLPKLCELSCEGNLDLCDIQKLPGTPMPNATWMFPMNWRFLPTLDPQVNIYLSRDLDSEFNDREIAAVNEWLKSDKAFHMMRDHPLHDVGMLGSAWGVKLTSEAVRRNWRRAWSNGRKNPMMWKARNLTGPDQGFLQKYVWPWAKKDSMQHDSYLCRKYAGTKGFPVQRKNQTNNFMAAVVAQNQYIWKKCPTKCRPTDHKDWEYC